MPRTSHDHAGFLGRTWDRAGIHAVAVVLLVVGTLVSDQFLTPKNLMTVLNAVALLGIAATGMTFVTYSGHMADLSLPTIMAFSGIISVAALPLGLPAALLLGMAAGMAIGAVNGIIIGRLNANPILWTLSVSFLMEGFMRFTWSNNQVYPDASPGSAGAAFCDIFRLSIGPVPLVVLVMLLMFVLGHVVLTKTRFGFETKLVGSSRPAAATSGIHVPRVVFFDFLAASCAASVAGILITSMNKLGVFYLGKGYDFKSVTAVVIGGVMLSGGRGTMPGVLGGVMVIGLLANIMTFIGINTFQQNIVTGSIFILVVGVHQYRQRRRGRDHA